MPRISTQAKESWEMDTKEKLEQAAIVKEKGTVYFKVCESASSFPVRHLPSICEPCWGSLGVPPSPCGKTHPLFLQACCVVCKD